MIRSTTGTPDDVFAIPCAGFQRLAVGGALESSHETCAPWTPKSPNRHSLNHFWLAVDATFCMPIFGSMKFRKGAIRFLGRFG